MEIFLSIIKQIGLYKFIKKTPHREKKTATITADVVLL